MYRGELSNWLITLTGVLKIIECKQAFYWQCYPGSAFYSISWIYRGLLLSIFLERILLSMLLREVTGAVFYHLIDTQSSIFHHQWQDLEQTHHFAPRGLSTWKPHHRFSASVKDVSLKGAKAPPEPKSPVKHAVYSVCVVAVPVLPRALNHLWDVVHIV